MKLSIAYKLSISSIFLVVSTALVVGILYHNKTTDLLVSHALEDIAKDIKSTGNQLLAITSSHDEDVLFIANTPPVHGMLRAKQSGGIDAKEYTTYEQWTSRLSSIFASYITRKKNVLRVRFIDKDGMELVSVGRSGSNIQIYVGKQLQNKSKRTYFKKARNLPSGSVFISEINLNREHGEIIKPHQEVIRNSTPVYDKLTGEFSGVVVITSEIGQHFHELRARFQRDDTQIYITNDRGGYLLHPDISKEYGFDLEKRYRVQEDLPDLATFFIPDNREKQKILVTGEGEKARVVNFTKIQFDQTSPDRFIAVIISQNYASIVSEQSHVVNELSLLVVILVLAGTGLAIFLSFKIAKPIKQMTSSVNEFSKGKPSFSELPVNQNDEVGTLAKSFNKMIGQIQESQSQLRDTNQNLERLVKARTESLEVSEKYQRTILKAIADAVVTIDSQGVITGFNPAAENMFGYEKEEAIGCNVAILLTDEERDLHDQYIQASELHTARIINRSRELIGKRKDGAIFAIELNVAPIQGDSDKGFVGILRDITVRNQARQEILNALETAESANRAKSEFLSNMSHELRTPLNAIMGFSQILKIDNKHPLNDIQEQNVDEIFKAGDHLLGLINELLDLAKIEAGHIELSIEAVELGLVIADSLNLILPLAEKRGITTKIVNSGEKLPQETLSRLPIQVRADHIRLKQVILNLLSNAVKYNSEQGNITIALSQTSLGTTRISISDTGSGLNKEQQSRLFNAFDRLGQNQAEIEGTGIGLVITKNITELMGGRIGVESEPGVGSTFWVEFSNELAFVKEDTSTSENVSSMRDLKSVNADYKNTVLYIEDNPANLRLVSQLLTNQPNIHMWSAHEPFLGLELALQHKPDLILLDINLPGMDGYEVLAKLLESEELSQTPVIAISANAMPKDIQRGLDAGFYDYITKPIDIPDLLDSIEKVFSSNNPHFSRRS